MKIIAITNSGSKYILTPERTGDVDKVFFVQKEDSKEAPVEMINLVKHLENLIGQQILLVNNFKSSRIVSIIITE